MESVGIECEHIEKYPVQSLYYCCLNYLRKNHRLINFTILSIEVGDDMAAVMNNPDHLKKFNILPYRKIKLYNYESYIYKYYFEEMHIYDYIDYTRNFIANGDFHEYIPGVLTVGPNSDIIYNPENGNCYTIYVEDYDYRHRIRGSIFKKLYPDVEFHVNSKGFTKIVSEDFFDQYPGLADWAESVGFISKKLWIPENLITW